LAPPSPHDLAINVTLCSWMARPPRHRDHISEADERIHM
jgi:hypothetical protein